MNENIVNQLTDPQNNKEQFVHEMTEVYLLLNEELKNFNMAGTVKAEELDIPDASSLGLSEAGVCISFKPVNVTEGTSITLSFENNDKNRLEIPSSEIPAARRFDSPSFPLPRMNCNAPISADLRKISISEEISGYCPEELKTVVSVIKTERFDFIMEYQTKITPKKVISGKYSEIRNISESIKINVQNCTVSSVERPAVQAEIKLDRGRKSVEFGISNVKCSQNSQVQIKYKKVNVISLTESFTKESFKIEKPTAVVALPSTASEISSFLRL